MRTLLFLFALAGCIWLTGCDIINPHEQVPTYVHIDSFAFAQTGDSFGSNSHKITTVWVYVDNEQIGTYTMPCTFPVIADKPFELRVAPGIDFNGLAGLRGIYNFYTFDSSKISPQPGKIVQFTPKTKYTNIAKMPINMTFDAGRALFVKFSGTGDSLHKVTDPNYVFEGTGAAYLALDSPYQWSENVSTQGFAATVGQNVFIELNYKCSIPFAIGLSTVVTSTGATQNSYISGLNVHEGWNKVYLSVQDFINTYPGTQYNIMIRAGTDYGEAQGYINIDNLKVITF